MFTVQIASSLSQVNASIAPQTPCISPHLPTSPHSSPHTHTSPHTSPHTSLHTSPHTSPIQLVTFGLNPTERRLLGLSCSGDAADFRVFAVVSDPPADGSMCGGKCANGSTFFGGELCCTLENGLHAHYMSNHQSFAHYSARGRDVSAKYLAKASWKRISEQAQAKFVHYVVGHR